MWSFFICIVVFSLVCGGRFSSFDKEYTSALKMIIPWLIIIHHISQGQGIFQDFLHFGPYGVGIFFFISGYGMQVKNDKGANSFRDLRKRYKNLFFPILVPVILYIIILTIFKADVREIICRSITNFNIILPFTWFFLVLSGLYAIFFLVSHIFHTDSTQILSLIVIVCVSMYLGYHFNIPTTYWCSSLSFPAGVIFRKFEYLFSHFSSRLYIGIASASTLLCVYLTSLHIKGIGEFLIPALSVLSAYLISTTPKLTNKISTYLASISYEVYVCQGIAFYLINKLPVVNPYFYAFCILVVTFIIAAICNVISNLLRNGYGSK